MLALRLATLAAVPALLLVTPALAAGADGKWDCTLEDGSGAVGSLGVTGNTYIFANLKGPSGRGAIAYQEGAQDPTFVVLNGALIDSGVLGGALDASIPDEPQLTLVDQLGNRVDCVPRK
jgi:hypothetical protein